jgi:hypothetical protein
MAEGASRLSQEEIDAKNERMAQGDWQESDTWDMWTSDDDGSSWKNRVMGVLDPLGLIFPYHDKEDVMTQFDPATGTNVYDRKVAQALEGYRTRESPADVRAKMNLSRAIMANRARGQRGGGPMSQAASMQPLAGTQGKIIGRAGRQMGSESAKRESLLNRVYRAQQADALRRALSESKRRGAILGRDAALSAEYDTQGARNFGNLLGGVAQVVGGLDFGGGGNGGGGGGGGYGPAPQSQSGGYFPEGYGYDSSRPQGQEF